MLLQLRIENLATIRELDVEFTAGFSILTGETGAGKSIMIDAILLVLGKGHEEYQETYGVKKPHSDKKIILNILYES